MTRSKLFAFAMACAALGAIGQHFICPALAGGFFNNRSVGGVAITTDGVLEAPTIQDQRELEQLRAKTALEAPAALQEFTERRAVSLKQIEAAIAKARAEMKPIPDDVVYLAGLQRVNYVLVYPDRNDIVLVGPAEGWKMDALGNVVGATTNLPVLMLDDLMVALRSGASSRAEPITCSIDPTPEGLKRLQSVTRRMTSIGNRPQTLAMIEEALGPQIISVTGVPDYSHFARTMVAADFRMKRLAMNFEPAPVEGMPSYLTMMRGGGRGMSNTMPRWWLAPNYEPLAKTADGLAWELRGPGVKCMTEQDYVGKEGLKERSGTTDGVAQKWAATMTAKFTELAKHDSSFGHLRNIMDLAVVGALIEKEQLRELASLEIPRLMRDEELDRYPAPKQTTSKASVVRKNRGWAISASGGIEMLPWHIADKTETVEKTGDVRTDLESDVNELWWE